MKWSDELHIETPEQIAIQLEVAGVGSRFVAQFLDWIIKWAILAAIAILVAVIVAVLPKEEKLLVEDLGIYMQALFLLLFYALLLVYDIFFEYRNSGQTPGKRYCGIRVVLENGAPIDFRAAAVRNLLGLADFLPMLYLLGALLMMVNKKSQRLGDMAGGTVVVRERAAVLPREDDDDWLEDFAGTEIPFTPVELDKLAPADLHVLKGFFDRYDEMERQPRTALARKLMEQYRARMDWQSSAERIAPTDFLGCLYRELKKRKKYAN